MYILKDKQTEQLTIVAEKLKLSELLGIHRNTLNNKLKTNKVIESEKYLLILPFRYYPATKNKGNRDSYRVKKAKSEGEIEENDDYWS